MSIDKLINEIDENAVINIFAKNIPRSHSSRNVTHESDAEFVEIGLPDSFLAVTTDRVAEEISSGLYTEPELMGWMAVVVNLSDLAAVGARPSGILLSITLSSDWGEEFIEKIVSGIRDACSVHMCGSLGGDLNYGEPALGATALGLVHKARAMKRTGMAHGDRIYVTAPVGIGGAYALAKTLKQEMLEHIPFKPMARLKEAAIISHYATSCMDTSDGIIFTLDQLYRLNNVCLNIDAIEPIVHESVTLMANAFNLPYLAILAAIHGEFELCFTIPADREEAFLLDMKSNGFSPFRIGMVYDDSEHAPGVCIDSRPFNSRDIRNLWTRSKSKEEYIVGILKIINEFYASSQGMVSTRSMIVK